MAEHGKDNNIKASETLFTKEQLLKSKKYMEYRDILSAILEDKVMYSYKQTEILIDEFMKKEVK